MSDKKSKSDQSKKSNTAHRKIRSIDESRSSNSGRTSITGTNESKSKKN